MIRRGTTSPRRRRTGAALAWAALAWAVPMGVSAQSLHLAELFAEQGRLGDARAEVMAWFEIRGDAATPEELQHGLWLRGRLAEDRTAGLQDLQRLVEQHPQGPYTPLALTWLADAAAEAGDEGASMAFRARVVRDFPESEAADRAREWLHDRGLAVEEPAPPPEPPRQPETARGDSTPPAPPVRTPTEARPAPPATTDSLVTDSLVAEPVVADSAVADPVATDPVAAPDSATVDSVAVETPAPPAAPPPAQADSVVRPPPADTAAPAQAAPAQADSAPTPTPPPPAMELGPPVPGAAEGGAFAVQIGAFRNPDGAAGLVDELVAEGFEARLVQIPNSSLLRVRIGRFATLDAAAAELERVRARGRDGALVNDARRERVASR